MASFTVQYQNIRSRFTAEATDGNPEELNNNPTFVKSAYRAILKLEKHFPVLDHEGITIFLMLSETAPRGTQKKGPPMRRYELDDFPNLQKAVEGEGINFFEPEDFEQNNLPALEKGATYVVLNVLEGYNYSNKIEIFERSITLPLNKTFLKSFVCVFDNAIDLSSLSEADNNRIAQEEVHGFYTLSIMGFVNSEIAEILLAATPENEKEKTQQRIAIHNEEYEVLESKQLGFAVSLLQALYREERKSFKNIGDYPYKIPADGFELMVVADDVVTKRINLVDACPNIAAKHQDWFKHELMYLRGALESADKLKARQKIPLHNRVDTKTDKSELGTQR